MKISSQFSKYATHYGNYNIIQNQVVSKLVDSIKNRPKKILDLGCGNGALYKSIRWDLDAFIGVDFAKGMLELHPKESKVECLYGDFNDEALFKLLKNSYRFDYIVSASALQWADNLDAVMHNIALLDAPVALAIFTSATFQTLNATAGLPPLLSSAASIEELQKKYFPNTKFELVRYQLEFESVREMFRYIKKSGVSGSRRVLSYKATKKLMQEYPLNYLEFEVAFITH